MLDIKIDTYKILIWRNSVSIKGVTMDNLFPKI